MLLLLRLLLPPPQRERVQWLQRIVDEESTQALQVPRAYVQASTKHATDYSRRVANDNARRAHTLTKISTAATEKSARRARESEFHRRWNHATKGEDTLSLPGEGDDAGADLDEITQLAAQVRAQAQRHAVDGALPLDDGDGDGGLGLSLMDELSLSNHSGPARETPARSTVFRKVRRQILPGACLPACLPGVPACTGSAGDNDVAEPCRWCWRCCGLRTAEAHGVHAERPGTDVLHRAADRLGR